MSKSSLRIHCRLALLTMTLNLAHFASAQNEIPRTTNAPSKLPDVVVTGRQEPERTYAASNAVSATKLDIPLLETPQAISVVPRALLEDQGARKLDDVLKNVAGVSPGGYYSEWDYYRIRGFDVSYNGTYLDGLMNDSAPGEELWGLERVEVVKGPASSLYGQGPPGGFVNLISKRPQRDFFGEAQFTAGSFDFYEFALDVNAQLDKSESVYGRFNVLYRTADSFVDYAGAERIFIAPALTWQITPDTTLTFLTSLRNDQIDIGFALPASGTVLPNPYGQIPISRYIGNPALGNDEWQRTTRLGYEFKHLFNEHLSFRQNFRWYQVDQTSDDLSYPDYPESMEDDRTLRLSGYRAEGRFDGWRIDSGLNAVFDTGPAHHTLTVGVDYRESSASYDGQIADPIYFDIFNPDYAGMPQYNYDPANAYVYEEADSDFGIYAQDHVKLFEKLTLTLGGRYDHSIFDASPSDFRKDSFTPRAGATYELVPGAAIYANYSQSFKPQWFNTDASGSPVEPETGENFEIGLKTSLLDGRLNTLLAVYQLTRQNVATDNPATPDPFDSIVSGEQRSRGVELEGTFRLAPRWELTAAYTYTAAEITEDNTLPVGARLAGVPEHGFSAWTKYTLQDGPLKGLGFGLGGRYYTEQEGDFSYSYPFQLPAYGVMDTAVFFRRGQFHAQVNVNNVLDERYFIGSYDYLYVLPGEPLSVRATVGWSF